MSQLNPNNGGRQQQDDYGNSSEYGFQRTFLGHGDTSDEIGSWITKEAREQSKFVAQGEVTTCAFRRCRVRSAEYNFASSNADSVSDSSSKRLLIAVSACSSAMPTWPLSPSDTALAYSICQSCSNSWVIRTSLSGCTGWARVVLTPDSWYYQKWQTDRVISE
jgi:hypothetical protein